MALDDLKRSEIGVLKVGIAWGPGPSKALHALTEFGGYTLHATSQLQAASYLSRLEQMPQERMLEQDFNADYKLPEKVS